MDFKNLTPIQTTILIVFIVGAIVGVGTLAFYSGGGSNLGSGSATVTIWGPYDTQDMTKIIRDEIESRHDDIKVTYRQVPYSNFDDTFVTALADQNAPDLVFLPEDRILKHRHRISPITFDTYSERTFKDTYIEAAEIFLEDDQIIGLPVTIDPLVMYWNRSLFNEAEIAIPPQSWSDLNTPRYQALTRRNGQFIEQSMVSFGGYENVTHAKYIIAMLTMQAGNPITKRRGSSVSVVFADSGNAPTAPALAAVNFYTQFANPSKQVYTWNSSLPESKQAFLNTDLAVYLGFASERADIIEKNPNLNFDVAPVPRNQESNAVSARLEALAIVKQSPHKANALTIARTFSSRGIVEKLADTFGYPPVRRDIVVGYSNEAHQPVFRDAVFRSQAWLDPDPKETNEIFARMISNIRSGRLRPSSAVDRAHQELAGLLD